MDVTFQKVRIEDKPIIDRYLALKEHKSCEMSFANIYLWSRFFPTDYAVVEDALIFRSRSETRGVSITFPAGELEQVKAALDVMLKYFKEQDMPFYMHLVQEPEFRLLEQWYPGRFQIEYDRDAADYVYETEKLTTLAGKKLHGKRNHINNFKKQYPGWSYETLTPENREECFQMALKWREEHECEYDQEKRDEMCVTLNALRLMEELEFVGGILKIDGEVVAFTLGEPLNQDTFVVHIEKAFKDIQGAYPMINQQFIEHEAQAYQYVNREEDTGSEGLRKAKLSYRPVFLVEKGLVSEKQA